MDVSYLLDIYIIVNMVRSQIRFLFLCCELFGAAYTQRYFTDWAPSVPDASNFIRRAYHCCKYHMS